MAEIIIESGVTSTGLVAESGDTITILAGGTLADGTVRNGAVVNGTFGAIAENLKTEAGATVNLETATGSGLQLKGNATEIAADTLYWNGNLVHGATTAAGVLSGVSSTDPYRFCVGDGITVLDASLTSGTRIYTYGDSLVSRTTILESGNVGMTEADTVGREITVGGAGVAEGKATLQIRGTAYDTVVSEGGRANIYKTASDTDVYAGGFLEVKEGGSAVGAEIHGGSMGVSAGAYASGANVSAGASMVILDGGSADTVKVLDGGAFTLTGDTAVMRDFTVEEGGKFIVSGGNGSGATVSGATVTPLGGNSGYALIDQATVYDFNVENGATANSMTVKRATWTGGTVRGGSNTTDRLWVDLNYYNTLNNVTFTTEATESATGICLVSAGGNGGIYLNDVTVKNFAYLEYARGTAKNLSILDGGFMYMRAIAVISGLTISGMRNGVAAAATMNLADNRVVDACIGSGGKLTVNTGAVSGATVKSGGQFTLYGDTAVVSDFKVEEGGKFYISGTAASGATVSGATVTPLGGNSSYAYFDKATLYDFNVVNGSTANSMTLQRTTWTGGTVRGGSNTTDRLYVNLNYTMALNNVTFTTDAVESDYRVCLISAGGNGNINMNDVTLENFAYMEYARGTARNLKVLDGAKVYMRASAAISGAVISGVRNEIGAVVSLTLADNSVTDVLVGSGGKLVVSKGKGENILVNKGGSLQVEAAGSATLAWLPDASWSGSVVSNAGATVTQLERDKGVYYGGTAEGLIAKADTMNGLEVDGVKTVYVYDGGTVDGASLEGAGAYMYASGGVTKDIDVTKGARVYTYNTGVVSNALFTSAGYLLVYGGTVSGAIFLSGGTMYYYSTAGECHDLVIGNGGIVTLGVASAKIENVTIQAGGSMSAAVYAAPNAISGTFTIDLNGGANLTNYYLQRRLAGITAASKIVIADEGAKAGDVYNLVSSADQNADCNFNFQLSGGTYAMSINAVVIDPFKDLSWKDTRNGSNQVKLNVTAAGHTIAAVTNAAALATSGSTLNGSDREARWTADTTYGDTVYAAEGMTTGNAWLAIDGANVDKALYGAAANQNFAGVVNMKLTSGSIRNLAGGAAAGGTVKAVNFTMAGGTLAGVAYAGGFGNVTDAVKTVIKDGETAEGKDFYAGALANYAKTNNATSVGDISLTIDGGTFGGNIYGASAVKASVAAAHAAGNVTLSITGGETAKGDQACIFAGGYATGSAADATVYTVGNIDATISGGSWGEAANGRGFFGGAFASGVTAEAQDVTITISGGTFGNVFGGGWAQKGGTSIVDDVEINIKGGTVTNVFGGGTHSTSGGATSTDDVTITVSGGNITGSIYAMGQSDGDAVVGNEVGVTFTGANDFGCDVFGYSYVGGDASDATLSYTGYTGTFSGAIGGFASITLDGATAMTIGTAAADVSNGAWTFDAAERETTLAGTAFLNWMAADFADDTIALNLAEGSATEWSLVNAAADTAYGKFDVLVDGTEIATELDLDQAIAAGDYAGWGFTTESGVLKFKNLA